MRNGHWRGEVVNYTKDGSERILDCRTQVVRDEKGRPYSGKIWILISCRDAMEQKSHIKSHIFILTHFLPLSNII